MGSTVHVPNCFSPVLGRDLHVPYCFSPVSGRDLEYMFLTVLFCVREGSTCSNCLTSMLLVGCPSSSSCSSSVWPSPGDSGPGQNTTKPCEQGKAGRATIF